MFRQDDFKLTDINLSTVSIANDCFRFPENFSAVLYPAIDSRNFATLQILYCEIRDIYSKNINLDRVAHEIYYSSFHHNYSLEDFKKLQQAVPVNINELIQHKVNNGRNEFPTFPVTSLLHLSLQFSKFDITDHLVDQGADVNIKDDKNQTATEALNNILIKKDNKDEMVVTKLTELSEKFSSQNNKPKM